MEKSSPQPSTVTSDNFSAYPVLLAVLGFFGVIFNAGSLFILFRFYSVYSTLSLPLQRVTYIIAVFLVCIVLSLIEFVLGIYLFNKQNNNIPLTKGVKRMSFVFIATPLIITLIFYPVYLIFLARPVYQILSTNRLTNTTANSIGKEVAVSGIMGKVTIGPTCPVTRIGDNSCADRPYKATILIKDEQGVVVTKFTTENDGIFKIGLTPGTYTLENASTATLPVLKPVTAVVNSGAYTTLNLSFDNGIR